MKHRIDCDLPLQSSVHKGKCVRGRLSQEI